MSDIAPIMSRGPRKYLSAAQKQAIVSESFDNAVSVAEIARNYNVGLSSLIKWRQKSKRGSLMGIKANDDLVPVSELKALKKRIRQLERLLGQKTVHVAILQEGIELAREKKLISRQPLPGIDYTVRD